MNELINVEDKTLIEYFSNGGLKPVLEDIENLAKNFDADVTTAKGRAAITAQATKVQKSRKHLEDLRKAIVEDWTKKTKEVNSEGKKARDFLTNLQEEVRKPLTEWEQKERERVKAHQDVIEELESFLVVDYGPTSEGLKCYIKSLTEIKTDHLEEFQDKSEEIKTKALNRFNEFLERRIKYEKEQEELEKLRKEKEERDKRDYEDRLKREAAEKAKREAEEKARIEQKIIEKEKQDAIQREKEAIEKAKKLEQEKIEAARRAEEEKILAEKQAAKNERKRIEAEKQEQIKIENEKRKNAQLRLDAISRVSQSLSEQVNLNKKDIELISELIVDGKISGVTAEF